MSKILLLEDDEVLSETLVELLEAEGFEVALVSDGEMALEATFGKKYDLFLLDVNVPFLDGFELLKSLRENGDKTPSIFITALTDISSLSKGFEVGADDYIKKPFDFDELLVRIKALLKKQFSSYANEINLGSFKFDIEKEEFYKYNEFMPLPPVELQITKVLFQNLNKTVKKEFLLEELSSEGESREGALRVHINKLRKRGLPVQTIKGIGYRLGNS